MKTRLRDMLGRAALVLGGGLLGLILIEGVSSLVVVLHDSAPPPLAEGRYVEYDSLLGWVSRPSVAIADLYGPGIGLHTNRRGFRGSRETGAVPAGTTRVVCSGDSFTLGYGVSDEEAWCALLGVLEPGLETVNMGQGGYGVDQAYLWFMRDGLGLGQRFEILSFITDDFRRMTKSTGLWGFGKPQLVLRQDSLLLEGVPVTRKRAGALSRLRLRLLAAARDMRAWSLLERLRLRLGGAPQGAAPVPPTEAVTRHIFEALRQANAARGSTLILVYLPIPADYAAGFGATDSVRAQVRRAASDMDIPFVDAVERLRQLPRESAMRLFITQANPGFADTRGHLSPEGNQWVAQQLAPVLRELRAVRSPAAHHKVAP